VAGECHANDILSLLLLPSLLLLVLPSLVPLSCHHRWCHHRIAVADGLAIKKGQKKGNKIKRDIPSLLVVAHRRQWRGAGIGIWRLQTERER